MAGPRRIPLDTSTAAHAAQTESYRRLGGTGRLAVMFRLSEGARQLALAGIQSRHPEYDAIQARLALARLLLGDELAKRVWPETRLVDP
jgi:hypothetical protein